VDKEEFGIIIRALGENPSLKDIDDLFNKSASGSEMTLDSFMNAIQPRLSGGNFTSEQIVEMFKVFDKDGDGHVSANEIRSVMAGVYGEPLTEAEIEEVIKLADVDGDGQIDYNEFVRLVLNKAG
jgi:calmodulin